MSRIFFNKVITLVQRHSWSGNKSSYSNVSGVTPECYLEPLSEEMSAQSGLQWGNSFRVFVDVNTNIQDSDKITIDSVEYMVKGTQNWEGGRGVDYMVLLVVKAE